MLYILWYLLLKGYLLNYNVNSLVMSSEELIFVSWAVRREISEKMYMDEGFNLGEDIICFL